MIPHRPTYCAISFYVQRRVLEFNDYSKNPPSRLQYPQVTRAIRRPARYVSTAGCMWIIFRENDATVVMHEKTMAKP